MWLLAAVVPVAEEWTSLAAEMTSYPKSMNVIALETRPMADRGSIVNCIDFSTEVISLDVGMLDTGKASRFFSEPGAWCASMTLGNVIGMRGFLWDGKI